MTKFKQVREAARNLAVQATGDDGEEAKLNDLPSDASQLDDADENNRNPDGSAEDQVEKSIKPIYTKTENGTYTLASEAYKTPAEKKAERLAKIARAAAARDKDQAAQKEKAKEKHYAASAKSRESVKHLGNKDQFGRVREDVEQTDEGILDGGRVGGVRDKIDTAIRKNRINKQRELLDKSFNYTQSDPRSDRLTQKMKSARNTEQRAGQRMRNRKIEQGKAEKDREYARKKAAGETPYQKHQAKLKAKQAKQRNEEVEQTDESLRQRADGAMTFSNRQAAYSTAFKKAYGRGPSKQELRDAGVGKGGDNPAGAKAYQKAMSKLRPASRSGIKDKFVHKEETQVDVEIEITENTIDDIKKLTTLSQAGTVRFADGSSAKVSPQSATALLQTHGNLNTNNQKKFAKKLASSATEFAKLEKFALQQAKLSGRLYQLNNL